MLENGFLWYESIHPEDQPLIDQQLAVLQSGQNFAVEYRIRDAWGQWRWFNDKTFCVEKVGDEFVINGLALDITQQKQADAALRHRFNLETVLADISQLMITQPDLNLAEVLQPLGETFQACRVSVMVRRQGTMILDNLASWTAPFVVDIFDEWQMIDLASYPWLAEQWLQQQYILVKDVYDIPDAGTLEREVLIGLDTYALMLIPLSDHQGEAWGCITCCSTQQHPKAWSKEDADLLAIAGDLIYNYYERQQARKQLEQAKEAAEAANRAKTQFLTNMSHELRTPLNAVLGFAQMMDLSAAFPEEHREHLRILQRSGTRLLSLLNDILELASFEGHTQKLNKTLFNLFGLLDDVENMFHSSWMIKQSVNFQIVRAENLPQYITTDQTKLHSVLIHLLSNALKFTPHGEVRLDVVAIASAPLVLKFSVTDTGIGISETDQQKLFNNFVKLEGGEQLGQGSGIGLALSQKFAALMGSEITVSSNPNGGSCFTFELQCGDRRPEIVGRSPHHPVPNPAMPLPTPEAFKMLPLAWREDFYLAACAARSQRLEKLIAALPPEHQAIAQVLQQYITHLNFNQLADLSQP
ncbi:MAG: PAS domain-containing protein [Limnothrix sp. RL_2_0]|nr:PAS domain-containing protein [Limnothrix sp. RL_2_0]